MADVNMLSLEEQNILLWMAEAELGVVEPLASPITALPPERVARVIDRLVQDGLLSRELTLRDHVPASPMDLSVALTSDGAEAVVALWRHHLRQCSNTPSLM